MRKVRHATRSSSVGRFIRPAVIRPEVTLPKTVRQTVFQLAEPSGVRPSSPGLSLSVHAYLSGRMYGGMSKSKDRPSPPEIGSAAAETRRTARRLCSTGRFDPVLHPNFGSRSADSHPFVETEPLLTGLAPFDDGGRPLRNSSARSSEMPRNFRMSRISKTVLRLILPFHPAQ